MYAQPSLHRFDEQDKQHRLWYTFSLAQQSYTPKCKLPHKLKNIKFSSSKAIYGIARKLLLFVLLVYTIPVALLIPEPLGISALYVLYIGYLASEINSVLNHFKLAEDDKSMDPFIDFFKKLFEKKGKK